MNEPAPLIIKICGITRPEDGLQALAVGADWLGFIRWPKSPRYLPLDLLVDLINNLRTYAPRPFEAVGVYVNATRETIEQEAVRAGLDRIQLHGEETLEFARSLSRPVIKALRVRDAASLAAAETFPELDLLTDAYVPAMPGGTGVSYDYSLLAPLVACRRVLVAGGLHAANVAQVVRDLKPWGIDASSSLEISPGIKDAVLVREFIAAARQAARSV